MANYAVVRTDLMYGTDVRSGLVSIKYMGADGATPTEIENGRFLKVGALMDGEAEVYVGEMPTGAEAIEDVVLVASVEKMYDERKHNLDEFINAAGAICRGYRLHSGDVFSVTAEALDIVPEIGNGVALSTGTKLSVSEEGAIGTVIAIDNTARYTYYVIKIN